MALIETTDDIFIKVNEELKSEQNKLLSYRDILREKYMSMFPTLEINDKLDIILFDMIRTKLDESLGWFSNNIVGQYSIADILQKHVNDHPLFKSYAVLLFLALVVKDRRYLRSHWQLDIGLLATLHTELGIAFEL